MKKEDNETKSKEEKKVKDINKEEKKELKKEKSKKIKKQKNKETKKVKFSKLKVETTALVIAIMIILVAVTYVLNTLVKKANYNSENPIATITVENFGTITVKLYPEYAPNTVANFIALANNNFYNSLTFHRTIPDFMIQGGDKNGDGSGNATLKDAGISDSTDEYAIKGEFVINGFTQNSLKMKRGVIAMARTDSSSQGNNTLTKKGYDSASSQFFILTKDTSSLEGSYAGFGEVIDGMDVVDAISNVDVETRDSNSTDSNLTADKPIDPPVITSISVDTKGVDYGKPETLEPFNYYQYMMQQYYGSSYTNY